MDGTLALVDRERWAVDQFGEADLGDERRTRRLVSTAALMAGNSSGTIPQQAGSEAAARGMYRLFSMEDVTHEAVCAPHFAQTRAAAARSPLVFLVQDTTELNFTLHHACEGLGPIGHGGRMKGLHQHNMLAVDGISRRPLGLMLQRHHKRAKRAKGVGDRRAAQRQVPPEQRESHWWIESIESVGTPPEGTTWVHVGDRGEDVFGVYVAARKAGADWLIRVAQDRRIETDDGPGRLFEHVRGLAPMGAMKAKARRKDSRGVTVEVDVEMSVSACRVRLLPTRSDPAYRGEEPVECFVVRAWEAKPPKGVEPLEWILCTSLDCSDLAGARRAVEAYSARWMIEEFHKCEKTGCQVEMRRLEHVDRLAPLLGVLSVLAVWLLQLKLVARDDPDAKATELFDEQMVDVMAAYLRKPAATLTVGAFWRGIGLLGGHLGRRHDGPVGWLRAWRGWQAFQLILVGATLRAGGRPRGGRKK